MNIFNIQSSDSIPIPYARSHFLPPFRGSHCAPCPILHNGSIQPPEIHQVRAHCSQGPCDHPSEAHLREAHVRNKISLLAAAVHNLKLGFAQHQRPNPPSLAATVSAVQMRLILPCGRLCPCFIQPQLNIKQKNLGTKHPSQQIHKTQAIQCTIYLAQAPLQVDLHKPQAASPFSSHPHKPRDPRAQISKFLHGPVLRRTENIHLPRLEPRDP